MVKEASKCNEDLRKDFYDLAYHGLRAEHYELVHRLKDLECTQEEMSEEERRHLTSCNHIKGADKATSTSTSTILLRKACTASREGSVYQG